MPLDTNKQTTFSGHCWMDAVELAQKCSSLLKKSITAVKSNHGINSMLMSADTTGEYATWHYTTIHITH